MMREIAAVGGLLCIHASQAAHLKNISIISVQNNAANAGYVRVEQCG